ncbi:hypothetical protein L211DRAFT_527454 [Terfezia boudieri ATCC MYA-4762]|uniref:Uncharacterized protein n=1 Tax=Terfezia boudieri ATCC MYA-4762 TaxID=1051890 RepID=A0A3N4LBR0_9PEZI|nr:hypothetical protein L211DRAFT_527454 [Terfezia boudieri ATCC MYA-4762]
MSPPSSSNSSSSSNRNSVPASLPPPQTPVVYTYQHPIHVSGKRTTYVTSTYTYPAYRRPVEDVKRPLMKRIIRFIKYGPVD